jgi:hypothetical protein
MDLSILYNIYCLNHCGRYLVIAEQINAHSDEPGYKQTNNNERKEADWATFHL